MHHSCYLTSLFTFLFLIEAKVVVLNDKDFLTKVSEGSWIVLFDSISAPSSKANTEEFEKLEESMLSHGIRLVQVDSDVNRETAGNLELTFLSLLFVKNGDVYEYKDIAEGIPSLERLKEFVLSDYEKAKKTKLSITDEENSAVIISNENIEELVGQTKSSWLLLFFAPWCGHCKRMLPFWNRVNAALKETAIKVGKVDCTISRKTCSRFSVSSYPMIFFIKEGQVFSYDNPRTIESILEFTSEGWKEQKSIGGIPDITWASEVFDSILEFYSQHMLLSTIIGITLLAVCVGLLVTLLETLMGGEEEDVDLLKDKYE